MFIITHIKYCKQTNMNKKSSETVLLRREKLYLINLHKTFLNIEYCHMLHANFSNISLKETYFGVTTKITSKAVYSVQRCMLMLLTILVYNKSTCTCTVLQVPVSRHREIIPLLYKQLIINSIVCYCSLAM